MPRSPSANRALRRRPAVRRRLRPRGRAREAAGARASLRAFRQASFLAIALTTLLLVVAGGGPIAAQPPASADPEEVARATGEEARGVLAGLREGLLANLPRLVVAAGCLLFAWLVAHVLRRLLLRLLGGWPRAHAITAVVSIVVWIFAAGAAVSVVAGDVRGVLGSVGLVGLALSWALQTPIESFTGWLLNSFKGHYRVGDRIAVGDVVGDVYRIEVLTTTVWEIGGPERPGVSVHAEQPTGRLITFPNNEILAGTVINFTRDFPYVWDELVVQIANESDLALAMSVAREAAREVVGAQMAAPAARYEEILGRARLEGSVAREPECFLAPSESWTDLTIRYLVHARERRRWKSALTGRVLAALSAPAHAGRILPAYPRRQLQVIDASGAPTDAARGAGGGAGGT